MMNAAVPRHVLRETLNANDDLLTMSQSSGIASTLDDPEPARVTVRERAMASLGGPTNLKPHREQARTGSAAYPLLPCVSDSRSRLLLLRQMVRQTRSARPAPALGIGMAA